MKDYHINIFYSEADDGYIADIPDLEMCSTFGETPEEALAQALIAKHACWRRPALKVSPFLRRVIGLSFIKLRRYDLPKWIKP